MACDFAYILVNKEGTSDDDGKYGNGDVPC